MGADDEPIAPVTGVTQRVFADADLSAHTNGDDFDAMCAMEEEEEVQTVATKGKGRVPSSKKHVVADVPEVKGVLDQNAWTRQQVDRLVGEVQRLADAAFPVDLLRKLWRLSLDDQHDVLLGSVGTEGGLLETKWERIKRSCVSSETGRRHSTRRSSCERAALEKCVGDSDHPKHGSGSSDGEMGCCTRRFGTFRFKKRK